MEKVLSKKKITLIVVLSVVASIILAGTITLIVYGCRLVKYDDSVELKLRAGCSDFYYNTLNENQQKMYRMLSKEAEDILYNGKNKSSLGIYEFGEYDLSKNEAVDVWYAFRHDATAYFLVESSCQIMPNSIKVTIAPQFSSSKKRRQVLQSIEKSTQEVGELLKDIDDEYLKYKTIYDYVLNHTYYVKAEGKALHNGYTCSIAGVLDGDESTGSICQGYARSLSYLCNYFGIESIYVSYPKKNHALNLVKMYGEWYYADITYDGENQVGYSKMLVNRDLYWNELKNSPYRGAGDGNFIPSLPEVAIKEFDFVSKDSMLEFRTINRTTCEVVSCSEDATDVVIPSTYSGMTVTGIANDAFRRNAKLKSISIADTVKSIGSFAFGYCTNLTEIELPQSLISIGEYAFIDCISLVSIDIPDNVTSIMYSTFNGCKSLQNIDLPSSLSKIYGYAFADCQSLKEISLTDTVSSIGASAFSNCISLKSIKMSNQVNNISSNAFENCSNLLSIDLPSSLNTLQNNIFTKCNKLTIYCEQSSQPNGWEIYWNNDNRPVVWGAVKGQYGITDEGLHWAMSGDKADIVGYSGALTQIILPSYIDGIEVRAIRSYAFNNCQDLVGVEIPTSVEQVDAYAFYSCNKLTVFCQAQSDNDGYWGVSWSNGSKNIIWDVNSCDYGMTESGVQWYLDKDGVMSIIGYGGRATQLELPSTINGIEVTKLGNDAFLKCSELTSITIPSSITSINNYTFNYCQYLTIYCKAASEPIGWESNWNSNRPVVYDCDNNDVADDGNIYFEVDGIRYALKDGNVSVIGQKTTLSGVVVIPSKVQYKGVEYTVADIAARAFYDCKLITQIDMPNSILTIGENAFYNCNGITSINVPDGVKQIGDSAFAYCENLRTIYIPKSVEVVGSKIVFRSHYAVSCDVYCEAQSQPIGWADDWNNVYENYLYVIWGYEQ